MTCFIRLINLYPNEPTIARSPPSYAHFGDMDSNSSHLGLDVYRPLPYFVPYPSPSSDAEISMAADYSLQRCKVKPDLSTFSEDTRSVLQDYGLFHKQVLAAFIVRGILRDLDVRELFSELASKNKLNPTELSQKPCIQTCVNLINQKTCLFNLTIRRGCCEITGDKYYSLTLIRKSELFKLQIPYPPQVVDFRDKIIYSCLAISPTFSVSYDRCLKMSWRVFVYGMGRREPIGIQLAEVYLRKLISQKYLVTFRPKETWISKQVTLGVRTMEEVGHCVLTQFGNVFANCYMCQKTLLHGHECSNYMCDFLIHRSCFRKYIKNRTTSERTCPSCKTPWKESRMKDRVRKEPCYKYPPSDSSTITVNHPLDPNLLLPIRYNSPKGQVY